MKIQAIKPFVLNAIAAALMVCGPAALADDWPMFGRDASRNAVSPENNPPIHWQLELKDSKGKFTQAAKGIKYRARLGSTSQGGPVIADGLVWVGTNNFAPRDGQHKEDAAVLMCFRESDGKFLYQYVSPVFANGILYVMTERMLYAIRDEK